MNAWLIIGVAVLAVWLLFVMLQLIFHLLDAYAAHRREDLSTTREREQS